MKKSRIHSKSSGYREFFRDLSSDVIRVLSNGVVKINKVTLPADMYEQFFDALMQFSNVQADIDMVKLRYGLQTGVPMTLDQIGKQWEVTAEMIRLRVNRARRRASHPLNVSRTVNRFTNMKR